MRKSMVFLAMTLCVILAGPVWAQKARYEIAPKYPSFNTYPNRYQTYDSFQPGSWENPYQIKDKSTGQTWEVKPKYPSYGGRSDSFSPGTFYNPWEIQEK